MGLQLQLNKEADIEPSNIQFWIYFHNDFFQFSPCTTVRFFEQDVSQYTETNLKS